MSNFKFGREYFDSDERCREEKRRAFFEYEQVSRELYLEIINRRRDDKVNFLRRSALVNYKKYTDE